MKEEATTPAAGHPDAPPLGEARAYWRPELRPFAEPRLARSLANLATSLLPYLALMTLMYWALGVSYLLVLALAIPAAGFLVRVYIVFHDCTHGSFLPSKRANAWLGRGLGLLVFTPYESWRHSHAIHHATAGDLDRRGSGDVPTITVREYRARSRGARLRYRLFRNPLVMFGLGPVAMVIGPRLISRSQRPRIRNSVLLTDLALAVMVAGLCVALGWQAYLMIQLPVTVLAGAAGIWLFYVQHQFEDTYWESEDDWSFADAGLRGSSYLRLPRALQFFSGNIGFHHVHHLSARIPNYNLERAHAASTMFDEVPTISLRDGLRAVRLKLWDEQTGRLVSFPESKRLSSR